MTHRSGNIARVASLLPLKTFHVIMCGFQMLMSIGLKAKMATPVLVKVVCVECRLND